MGPDTERQLKDGKILETIEKLRQRRRRAVEPSRKAARGFAGKLFPAKPRAASSQTPQPHVTRAGSNEWGKFACFGRTRTVNPN